MGGTHFSGLVYSMGVPVLGSLNHGGKALFVNGTTGVGADGHDGESIDRPVATIQHAVDLASAYDTIYVLPKKIAAGGTDPSDYAETVIIPATKPHLSIIGLGDLAQGNLPQIKKGSGSTALITVRAPGCTLASLGINGGSSTGGGVLLDDDGSTKTAFGTVIRGCHFKNCVGSTATDSRTGGAIQWTASGNAWQVRIVGNQFYKNVGGIVLKGTGGSVPQDVVIAGNYFVGTAATVDCYIYLAGGSGMANVLVDGNVFASVLPALGSGSVVRYADLTGCTGIFSNNYFGGSYTTTGFGAAKAAAKIPTTVGLAHNYSDGGLIVREA